jgi:hypothetical protein
VQPGNFTVKADELYNWVHALTGSSSPFSSALNLCAIWDNDSHAVPVIDMQGRSETLYARGAGNIIISNMAFRSSAAALKGLITIRDAGNVVLDGVITEQVNNGADVASLRLYNNQCNTVRRCIFNAIGATANVNIDTTADTVFQDCVFLDTAQYDVKNLMSYDTVFYDCDFGTFCTNSLPANYKTFNNAGLNGKRAFALVDCKFRVHSSGVGAGGQSQVMSQLSYENSDRNLGWDRSILPNNDGGGWSWGVFRNYGSGSPSGWTNENNAISPSLREGGSTEIIEFSHDNRTQNPYAKIGDIPATDMLAFKYDNVVFHQGFMLGSGSWRIRYYANVSTSRAYTLPPLGFLQARYIKTYVNTSSYAHAVIADTHALATRSSLDDWSQYWQVMISLPIASKVETWLCSGYNTGGLSKWTYFVDPKPEIVSL